MKQLLYTVLSAAFLLAGVTACKNKLAEPPEVSLLQTISEQPEYSLFLYGINKARYESLLSTSPSVTVLLPSNSAFISAGYDSAKLRDMDTNSVAALIGYHLIGETVTPSRIAAASRLETRAGYYLHTSNNNGLFINNVRIDGTYISAANGIVIPISTVLSPPKERIYATLQADTSFSLYFQAVTRDSLRRKLFKDTFNTGNLFTVFAPTNNAFRRAGIDAAYISSIGYDTISRLVMRHYIANESLLYNDFIDNTTKKSAGDSILLLITGTNARFGSQAPAIRAVNRPDTTLYRLKTHDLITINGIMHSIDSLLPPRKVGP